MTRTETWRIASERKRRDRAQKHAGKVVEGSGALVEPRRLDHMVSLRLEPELLVRLRELAGRTGKTTSDLLRRGALLVITEDERAHAPIVQLRVVQGEAEPTQGSTTSNRITHIEDPRPRTA